MTELEYMDWTEAYLQLAEAIDDKGLELEWIDLWNEQPYYEEEEYPFPLPALFMDFTAEQVEDLGGGVQKVTTVIDFYHMTASNADTDYTRSWNMGDALKFSAQQRKLHAFLHGHDSDVLNTLNRIGYQRMDSPSAGIRLDMMTYRTVIMDYSGQPLRNTVDLESEHPDIDLEIRKEDAGSSPLDQPFDVPL